MTGESIEPTRSVSSPAQVPAQGSELTSPAGKMVKVVVRVLIDAGGQQSQAQVIASSGNPKIDQTALDKVATWRFVPRQHNSAKNFTWHVIPLTFHLQ